MYSPLHTHPALEGEGVAGRRVAVAVALPALAAEQHVARPIGEKKKKTVTFPRLSSDAAPTIPRVSVAARFAREPLVPRGAETLLDGLRLEQVGRTLRPELHRRRVQPKRRQWSNGAGAA